VLHPTADDDDLGSKNKHQITLLIKIYDLCSQIWTNHNLDVESAYILSIAMYHGGHWILSPLYIRFEELFS
jgi:hypothetical protein